MITNKQTSRRLARLPNFVLIQILKATVARLYRLEMELNELELALDDDQKEIEGYIYEIDECHDRMQDIDEFVRAIQAGEVPALPNTAFALVEMEEEREEEENAINKYKEARGWHEEQFQKLQGQCAMLKKERAGLHKTCIEICSIFRRSGVFGVIRARLVKLNSKSA